MFVFSLVRQPTQKEKNERNFFLQDRAKRMFHSKSIDCHVTQTRVIHSKKRGKRQRRKVEKERGKERKANNRKGEVE